MDHSEPPITNWWVRADVLEAVVAHARACQPAECCGMLVGRPGEVVEAAPAGNLASSPNRFLIDPQDHINVVRRARSSGLDIVGFYHSHPRSSPQPSPTDLEEASYRSHLYLIVGLLSDPPDVALYWLGERGFVPAVFVTVP